MEKDEVKAEMNGEEENRRGKKTKRNNEGDSKWSMELHLS